MLGRVAWFFVVVVAVGSLGGRRADPGTALFVLAGSGVLVALARYLSLRYWVESGTLVIRSGIVSRQVRTIPLERIQNVELRQNAVQRVAASSTSASRPRPGERPRLTSPCSRSRPPTG